MPSDRFFLGILPWYSILIVCGICVAILWCTHEEKRLGLYRDVTIDLALWVIPFGVVGARLYYVAFAWDTFKDNPLSILYIWRGGMAIYGALIGGLIAVLAFAHHKKISVLSLADMIAPGLALAQAIGRWGNFFNMEAYGLQITNPAWQFFPLAVKIPNGAGYAWHMATFFYESVWNLGVFLALFLTRRRMTRRGDTALWYALLYGAGRLIIEGLRTDSLMTGGGTLRVSQLLSVVFCLLVVCVFTWRMIRNADGTRRLAGMAALAVAVCTMLLLPFPSGAFFGYRAAWCAQAIITLAALAMGLAGTRSGWRWIAALPPALAWVGSAVFHAFLARHEYSGVEAATLMCCLFSLVTILTGCWVYTGAVNADLAAEKAA